MGGVRWPVSRDGCGLDGLCTRSGRDRGCGESVGVVRRQVSRGGPRLDGLRTALGFLVLFGGTSCISSRCVRTPCSRQFSSS